MGVHELKKDMIKKREKYGRRFAYDLVHADHHHHHLPMSYLGRLAIKIPRGKKGGCFFESVSFRVLIFL